MEITEKHRDYSKMPTMELYEELGLWLPQESGDVSLRKWEEARFLIKQELNFRHSKIMCG